MPLPTRRKPDQNTHRIPLPTRRQDIPPVNLRQNILPTRGTATLAVPSSPPPPLRAVRPPDEFRIFLGLVPLQIVELLRSKTTDANRQWAKMVRLFLMRCFAGRPSSNKFNTTENQLTKYRNDLHSVNVLWAMENVRHHSFLEEFQYMSIADTYLIATTTRMNDDLWLQNMTQYDKMWRAYLSTLAAIYTNNDPAINYKCAYLMLLDRQLVFIGGLSLRQRYRLFILGIFTSKKAVPMSRYPYCGKRSMKSADNIKHLLSSHAIFRPFT